MVKNIKVGSDFSGVGAFNQAISRIDNLKATHIFACDMDKFARMSYIENYGEPNYYPENVYDREMPSGPLDVYMTSPPCQSFSLAGKRKGKDSENGILFFNSHEFIQKNKPRFFIFENVKGLLSDDNGNTFKEWCNMLGGKTINGNPIIFPFENSVPYHIYFKVLNSKKHGVPQNRERVFIIGIRDDSDNVFSWPKEEFLSKKLKDVLETDVPDKYFLSDKMVSQLIKNTENTDYLDVDKNEFSKTLRCGGGGSLSKKHSYDVIKIVGNTNPSNNGMNGNVFDSSGISPTISTNKGEGPKIKVKSATSKGYETATINDSINFTHPDSKIRRGRVGKEVAQTLDTACNQGIIKGDKIRKLTPRECFRLQDFPDTFKFVCSDSQLYKQAGNSITVRVLELIIRKLKL
jgi:DNA (cytosine-5)-methyltransferase 1